MWSLPAKSMLIWSILSDSYVPPVIFVKNDEDVVDEIYRLREMKKNSLVENAEREGKRQRIAEMTDFLNEQSYELEEYDEQLVRRLIERITVFDDKLTVEFKSGVEIDIEI